MIRRLKAIISKDLERNSSGIMDICRQHLTEGDEENRENVGTVSRRPSQDSNLALREYSSGMLL